jgi:hypothetical protein
MAYPFVFTQQIYDFSKITNNFRALIIVFHQVFAFQFSRLSALRYQSKDDFSSQKKSLCRIEAQAKKLKRHHF